MVFRSEEKLSDDLPTNGSPSDIRRTSNLLIGTEWPATQLRGVITASDTQLRVCHYCEYATTARGHNCQCQFTASVPLVRGVKTASNATQECNSKALKKTIVMSE